MDLDYDMDRLEPVLDLTALGDVTPGDLADRTGIPIDRVEELLARQAAPSIAELANVADALSVNPSYLVRSRPAVVARRDSGFDNAQMDSILERFDLHVEAFARELAQPEAAEAFPAKNTWGARAAGAGWASRHDVSWDGVDKPDRLLTAIENDLRIPVLIWPVAEAPFGATLSLGGTLAIWVNSQGVPGSQQRFTLAHELGHILLRHASDTRIEPTITPDEAERINDPAAAEREQHANAFASGVFCDRDRLLDLWDGGLRLESIAWIVAGLGVSFEAACVCMKVHLKGKIKVEHLDAVDSAPHEAFGAVGHSGYVEWYMSFRGRRRVPAVLRHKELLEESLASLST